MTTGSNENTMNIDERLALMSEQLEMVTAELREQRLRRQRWEDLASDLAPISTEAMALASRELEAIQEWVEPADMLRLIRRIVRNTNNIEEAMAKYESTMEFIADLGPLTSGAFTKLLESLDDYEKRGYFEFTNAGIGVVDKIVTNFSKEDVNALGDNVVHMLEIVKDLTQPEMLAVAERLLDVVQRQAQAGELEPDEAPGLFALITKMRDPEIRRGIARALNTFKAVSASESDVASNLVETKEPRSNADDTLGGA